MFVMFYIQQEKGTHNLDAHVNKVFNYKGFIRCY